MKLLRIPLGINSQSPHLALRLMRMLAAAMLAAPLTAVSQELDQVFELDAFVITAVAEGKPVQRQSVSISSLSLSAVEFKAPRSTTEILRSIPGIRSESTAGDGNTNVAIRGMPISAGGSKYLQFHEDGLPVLEFGDIAFATPDSIVRTDLSLGSVEAIKGGSASTFASNAPGGVINFLTKTGEMAESVVRLEAGVDHELSRFDFAHGGPAGEDWNYFLGGYYRTGEGIRDLGYSGYGGGQLKANLTRNFTNGYLRFHFKMLNESVPTYLPMPIRATGNPADPDIGSLPGFDAKTDTPHSAYLLSDTIVDGNNNVRTVDVRDGLFSEVIAAGLELSLDLPNGWKLVNRGRVSSMSGRFVAPFTAEVGAAQAFADARAGGPGATIAYANGPLAGQAIADPGGLNGNGLLQMIHMFNTELNDFGTFHNDLRLSNTLEPSGVDELTLSFGLYQASQNIDMDWHWNGYVQEVKGDSAALVDIFDASGAPVTENGLFSYGPALWGYFRRSFDTSYDILAPYGLISADIGGLNIEASVRYDSGKARGQWYDGTTRANFDVNGDGIISAPERLVGTTDKANPNPVNYDWDYTSYSLGANYMVSEQLAVFGRASEGHRANADRIVDQLGPDGSITNDGATDTATQYELGAKYRSQLAGGQFALFGTFFYAETEESNYEATTQRSTSRLYEAAGIELEGEYLRGPWSVRLGLTYSDAEIAADNTNPANNGRTPRRVPDWMYSLTGTYRVQGLAIGASLIGQTKAFAQDDNVLVMPGYSYVTTFVSYEPIEGLSLGLWVNNLFDSFGLSESEEGSLNSLGVIRARGITGRSISATLRYEF